MRLGRKWDGCLSKVETVRLKAWRFVFSKGAMMSLYAHGMYVYSRLYVQWFV